MTLSSETLLKMYWTMLLARMLDEQAWLLHRQGKIAFHISAIGHEAIQVGAAFGIKVGYDWVAPYYRDLGLMLALGLSPKAYMLSLKGKKGDPSSDGRQMPGLWSLKQANVISHSGVLAAQAPQAVGIALAIKLREQDRVVLVSTGEGATSTGEWMEAVNWAAVQKLPVIFLVQNNRFAISMRQETQMAVESVAEKAGGLGLIGTSIDGSDMVAVQRATSEAAYRARTGGGPTLLEARTYRITPHSSDDDDRLYRTKSEVEAYRQRDPFILTRTYLEEESVLSPKGHEEMVVLARKAIDEAVSFAEEAPYPAPDEASGPIYARGDELCLS
jgi:2-oxoisovalerate dehydrogenase E1 component alpha subunit